MTTDTPGDPLAPSGAVLEARKDRERHIEGGPARYAMDDPHGPCAACWPLFKKERQTRYLLADMDEMQRTTIERLEQEIYNLNRSLKVVNEQLRNERDVNMKLRGIKAEAE